ncbi:MAG TPA: septum formation initiator family protein [Micromonosporaceae bacterium]|jgi:cell division protein FtsB
MTGRATALCLVLLALMLAYAYPVRLYLKQEAQIQQLQTAQAAQRARIKSLTQQTIEWNDPAYIKAQARARFFMVPPGTKTYVVQTPTPTTPPSGAKTASTPWYGQLWQNIRGADDPGASK